MTDFDSTGDLSDREDERESPPADQGFVVGVGASAGGLQALTDFFGGLTDASGMAFVVVQHLAPEFDSGLVGHIQSATDLSVEVASDGTTVRPGQVYVISPGERLLVRDGTLRTETNPDLDSERHTIDDLFRSIGETYGVRSVGVLLSGRGSDGTSGLRAIKGYGGLTMAQEPAEAGSSSMPGHALDAGVVDFSIPVAEIAKRLTAVASPPGGPGPLEAPLELADKQSDALDAILATLEDRTGNDLSNYKRPTVLRRIARRMRVVCVETLDAYAELLRDDPTEVDTLFGELLIGVTRFFRDRETWDVLGDEVVPRLFEGKGRSDQVRVWCPGCATGEEAYSLAILLTRHARELEVPPGLKLFATDVDADAVDEGRRGTYSSTIATDIPSELFEEYFQRENGECRVRKSVREHVLFAQHNVLTDPPFSNLDLISCRNVLIYLQPEAQVQLLNLFHYALRPDGYLLVGPSETTAQAPSLFETADETHGIYQPRSESESDIVVARAPIGFEGSHVEPVEPASRDTTGDSALEAMHRSSLIEKYAPASVLVDRQYKLLHALGDLDPYLSVPSGEASDEFLPMVAESIRPRVRTIVFEAFENPNQTIERRFPSEAGEGEKDILAEARQLKSGREGEPIAELSFRAVEPVSEDERDQTTRLGDGDSVTDQLERELRQARSRLRSTVERYETANEKLRASNEELISMNEELQSATEELETSKEELQSMNEELTTVNEELNSKIDELDALNADLQNLLRSTEIGTVFLNRDFEVQRFTESVTEYCDLVEADIGRPFSHVTHRFEHDLLGEAQNVLEDVEPVERELGTEQGDRHFLFRALPYLTNDNRVDGVVLTFVDITERRRMQDELAESEMKFRSVFEGAMEPMFIYELGGDGEPKSFRDVNGAAVEVTGYPRDQLTGRTVCDLLTGEDFDCEAHVEQLAERGELTGEVRVEKQGELESTPVEFSATRVDIGDRRLIVEVIRDITDRKRYQEALVEARERAEELAELRSTLLSTLSHDVRTPLSSIMALTRLLEGGVEEEHAKYVDRIERAAQQLTNILNSILRMARVETNRAVADVEEFEMGEHLHEVVELQRMRADRKDLSLEFERPESALTVELDRGFVTQIVNNLVENAITHTEQGGVSVRLLEENGSAIRVEVEDSGAGIPEEKGERIFERFESSSGTESGNTGLGLAITKLLVEAMDGSIDFESELGEGTTFFVRFPRRFESFEQLE